MSDTDSFIDEVNEEVRRDRFYFMLKRYGWIAVLAVILLVGGAAWNEYQKAQARAEAETLGDAMFAALSAEDTAARAAAFENIEATNPRAGAMLGLLTAAEQAEAGETDAAVATLNGIGLDADVPAIYREIAQFKAITLQGSDMPANERRLALENLAQPGSSLRLLAQEQLAMINIEEDAPEAAIERYQGILNDADVTSDLQQRALQVIVALGGDPQMGAAASAPQTDTVPALDADNN